MQERTAKKDANWKVERRRFMGAARKRSSLQGLVI